MQEIYRYYFSYRDRDFVIVIFKSTDGYIAKIFENKKLIKEFTATISDEMVQSMISYSAINPFREMIDWAMDWVKNTFTT